MHRYLKNLNSPHSIPSLQSTPVYEPTRWTPSFQSTPVHYPTRDILRYPHTTISRPSIWKQPSTIATSSISYQPQSIFTNSMQSNISSPSIKYRAARVQQISSPREMFATLQQWMYEWKISSWYLLKVRTLMNWTICYYGPIHQKFLFLNYIQKVANESVTNLKCPNKDV